MRVESGVILPGEVLFIMCFVYLSIVWWIIEELPIRPEIVGCYKIYNAIIFIKNGGPRRTRTFDLPIMSRMLCGEVGQQAEERYRVLLME